MASYQDLTAGSFGTFLESTKEVGYVEAFEHPIIKIRGLPNAKPWELLVFEGGGIGQVNTLADELISSVSFSANPPLLNERVVRTGHTLEIGMGPGLLGRVVDPLGKSVYQQLDELIIEEYRNVESPAPGIDKRAKINQFFETGVAIVDMLIPLGKGQRELIIGDRKTGKTDFLLQTMLNQTRKGTL